MKRTKAGQKKHDESVKRSADAYKQRGYDVRADIPGEKKPKNIGGYIPDIIAKKGKKETVVEIETRKTATTDKKQQQAFKNYADKKSGRKFTKKII